MKYSKISVIIPVYNVEKYISDCIKSVIAQDYPNFEIIIVDDGSEDSSKRVCEEFLKKSGCEFRLISRPNKSV